jgi:hypothetical protein
MSEPDSIDPSLTSAPLSNPSAEMKPPPPSSTGPSSDGEAQPSPVKVDIEKAARFIEDIKNVQLSDTIERAIDGYEQVGHRNSFLWRWVRRGVEITTLSCIDADLWDHVCDTKTLGVMFDVLIDDVADEDSDPVFLDQLIAITDGRTVPLSDLPPDKRDYYAYSDIIWRQIWDRLETYHRYDEFQEVLRYDYRQLMNSMRYSLLIRNQPHTMNISEHDSYMPHNMHMMVSGTVDLMASLIFDKNELSRLRLVLSFAQHMGRIGNLVTTWEREIREKDFSSGVFPAALNMGVLTVDDLMRGDQQFISERIRGSGIEEKFLRRWTRLHAKVSLHMTNFKTVGLAKLLEGLETLIQLHLGSRGLK